MADNVTLPGTGAVVSSEEITTLNGGAVRDHNPHGWFETDAGDALVLNLSGAVAVGGEITYIEV